MVGQAIRLPTYRTVAALLSASVMVFDSPGARRACLCC
jgi:hypothetical protein